MFGVTIEGPTNLFCDNEAVYKNGSTSESTLRKKQLSIAYQYCREAVSGGVCQMTKEDTATNLADLLTKTLPSSKRVTLIDYSMY